MNSEYGLQATHSGEALALKGVDVSTRVSGLLAETRLVQKYRNDGDANLELTYTFPLPVAGTLLAFSVSIGDKKLEGSVVPRTVAETAYEKAIGEGNSAFRLQEIRPDTYNATLGNVMPGEAVEITLRYAETLAWNGKSVRYCLPTTIAPRYGQPTGFQPWQKPVTDLAAEYPLSVRVVIAGALAQSAIACPSHRIGMKALPDGLSIALADGATMDRDFVLEIENEQVHSLGVSAYARDTRITMLTLLPPETESPEEGRDVVLVIDCSGSMQGDSLRLAKEGVLLALGSLEPNERFGVVAFGTSFRQFDKSLQPANRMNLNMARSWVNDLENLGGTAINGALELALALHDGNPMDILLLTDGQDWQAGKSVPSAKEKGVRIFTMGIGSAVAEESIRMMAQETGGACELVSPTEDMSVRIYRHFNRMRQPQMRDLRIDWPATPLWESRPKQACFAGDAYTVFAALPESSAEAESVAVSFEFAGQGGQSAIVRLSAERDSADAIVRLAARHRLEELHDEEKQAWAVEYQLITDRTDYLVTMERSVGEKAEELPELQAQPQMLPAGWGGTSSVRYSKSRQSPEFRQAIQVQATGAYDAVAFSSSPDYSHHEWPTVLRCRNTSLATALADNGYDGMMNALRARAKRKIRSGLPKSYSGLKDLPLPAKLAELLELLLASHTEAELIASFYQALLEHDGKGQIDQGLEKKIAAAIGNAVPEIELVVMIVSCLNGLRGDRRLSSSVDRYDIPAFLRKQTD
ncbi:VIT and VWA domain-containing protein [Dechloromonas sp. ZS-1]|uniref:VIT and vWA domain-containing protein n=1 Tax=Dechloromonas sp. ZS-1 TaxID=3138067 RepID=UPI0031FCEE40